MKFIERTQRRLGKFDLDDREDVDAYTELLNNPAIKILNKELVSETASTFDSEGSSTSNTTHSLVIEYEESGI